MENLGLYVAFDRLAVAQTKSIYRANKSNCFFDGINDGKYDDKFKKT